MFALFNSAAEGAIAEGDAKRAAWAVAGAERFRSLLVFKQQLEEVVWMGHSAKRLVDILRVWDDNQEKALPSPFKTERSKVYWTFLYL